MKNRSLLFIFVLALGSLHSFAQDFDKEFFKENLLKSSYSIDTGADAVILYEKGEATFVERGFAEFYRYDDILHVHRIIKILKPSATDLAKVSFSYNYHGGRYEGYQNNIVATTYNMAGNEVVATKMDRSAITETQSDKEYYYKVEFELPVVAPGSVIDYQYDVSKNVAYDLPSWFFQGDYPALLSEFQLTSFKDLFFNSVLQGKMNFRDCRNKKESEDTGITAYKIIDKSLIDERYRVTWGRKNIPAITYEPNTGGIDNYRQLLQVQLNYSRAGFSDDNEDILTSWEKFDRFFKKYDYDPEGETFGKGLNKSNNFLDKVVDSLVVGKKAPLDKAKAIFNFVRSSFTCNDFDEIYTTTKFRRILKDREGNVGEINLLLTAMLAKAGLSSAPVVMSKVGTLLLSPDYPVLNRINYLISSVKIGGTRYFLDGSDKLNSFGVIPVVCYNGFARLIDINGTEPEKDRNLFLSPNDIKEKNIYYLNATAVTDSLVTVEAIEKIGRYHSDSCRIAWDDDSTAIGKVEESKRNSFQPGITLSGFTIENAGNPDTNLILKYVLTIKPDKNTKTINLNTDLVKIINRNFFPPMDRKLPVENLYKTDYAYIFNIRLPGNMHPEKIPGPVYLKCADGALAFKHVVSFDSSSRMLSVHTGYISNECFFSPQVYNDLTLFISEILKEEDKAIAIVHN